MIGIEKMALNINKKYKHISIETILLVLNEVYKYIDSLEGGLGYDKENRTKLGRF
jgi:hypothetical protein